jgi:Kip1 ubiquitination-promoting complex protein 1
MTCFVDKPTGDSRDSYAYDGNRVRKWNGSTAIYGETWQVGDTIGCCLDLDEGVVEYLR